MRVSGWYGTVAVACVVALGGVAIDADAAVLCERKGKIRLRAESCKPKETQVQDLGQLETRTTDADARFTETFEARCPGEPSRRLASAPPSFLYVNDVCDGGCRAHDADAAACAAAFQLTWRGPSACVHVDGRCVPCADCAERAGRCVDACQPVRCAAAARTRFMGIGGQYDTCRRLVTEETCNAGWALEYNRRPVSCWWNAGTCEECGLDPESAGSCANACVSASPCANPGLTVVPYCGMNDGNQPACEATWSYGVASSHPYSCWYHASSGQCRGCTTIDALRGDCTETCNAAASW